MGDLKKKYSAKCSVIELIGKPDYLLLIILFLTLFFHFNKIHAQINFENNLIAELEFDEIPVLVAVEGMENFYIDALFTDEDLLYLNFHELFLSLNLPCEYQQNREVLSGFIESADKKYKIDLVSKKLEFGNKILQLDNKMIIYDGNCFIESESYEKMFGITISFNYRSLTVLLKSNFELPILKKQRLDKIRINISKTQGEIKVDTSVGRNYHIFKPGVIDWAVSSYQRWKGSTDNFVSLGLGAELLYGEANISVNYLDRYKFDNRQINYLWKWVDNDKAIIKQAQLGKISNQTIAFINSPIVGGVIRNSPTTLRKAKGYYTINEYTEPNWSIELYINNILVDYTKADASGSFFFKVPITYGYTSLKLKFYGPMGEERTEERTMNMPYTIMPEKEFEYSLSGGIVQDTSSSRFGKAEFNYGLSRLLTVGGGLEYLSSIPNGAFIPFLTATFQPMSKLTLNAEYAHGVKARGLMNYYFGKNALLMIDYAKFVKGQLATQFNAQEELKTRLSIPYRASKLAGFLQLDYSRFKYETFNFNRLQLMLTSYINQLSLNSSTHMNWLDGRSVFVLSDLAFSYRINNGIVVRPSTQYNITENKFLNFKLALEKSIPKGYLTINYERNILSNENLISLGFKYDLNFARTNLSVMQRGGTFYSSESAQGSLAFGGGNNYVHANNFSSLGKGGISIYPFLDLNQNGVFDADEHMVNLNDVRIIGGRAIFSKKDSVVRIAGLNAFTQYIVEFDDYELDNIAWRFTHKSYEIIVDPNQFKRVDVPVVPVGEINGMVLRQKNKILKGIGRILIGFYKKNSEEIVAQTLTEYDGYIYYLGLPPGEYTARLDSLQMSNLGFSLSPEEIDFKINKIEDGDIVDGINFVLKSKFDKNEELVEENGKEGIYYLSQQATLVEDNLQKVNDTLYRLQVLALTKHIHNTAYFSKLLNQIPSLEIEENLGEDGLIHYSSKQVFSSLNDAHKLQELVKRSGWPDSFVASYIDGKRAEPTFRLRISNMIKKDPIGMMPNDTLYKVQVLALTRPIKDRKYFSLLKEKLPGLTLHETLEEDGLFHYSTGAFRDILQVQKLWSQIKKSGWKDSFISKYMEGKWDKRIYRIKIYE